MADASSLTSESQATLSIWVVFGREVHGKPAGTVMTLAFELDGQSLAGYLAAMRITQARFIVLTSLSILPGIAYAQYIPTWLAVAALSPLLVILLAVVLGFAARSWRVGAVHAGLVIAWVALFIFAARYIENDYVIWTPLLIYAAHALLILVLVVVNIAKRIRADGRSC